MPREAPSPSWRALYVTFYCCSCCPSASSTRHSHGVRPARQPARRTACTSSWSPKIWPWSTASSKSGLEAARAAPAARARHSPTHAHGIPYHVSRPRTRKCSTHKCPEAPKCSQTATAALFHCTRTSCCRTARVHAHERTRIAETFPSSRARPRHVHASPHTTAPKPAAVPLRDPRDSHFHAFCRAAVEFADPARYFGRCHRDRFLGVPIATSRILRTSCYS